MKEILYFVIVMLTLGVTSCLNDQTTGPHIDVSDIIISKEDTVLFPTVGVEFVFDPSSIISQTDPNCPLTYQWRGGKIVVDALTGKYNIEDSLKILSNEKVLKYTFNEMDPYYVRLQVTNKYGSTFQYFVTRPSSNFDEGVIMLSRNEGGEAMLSILNSHTDEEELLQKETDDFWILTSKDRAYLNDDIVDMAFCAGRGDYDINKDNYMYLLSKKNSQAYYLDHRSLMVINDMYKFSKVPQKLGLFYHKMAGFDLFTYCEDGDVFAFCALFGTEVERVAHGDIHHWDRCGKIQLRSGIEMARTFRDVLLLYDDVTSTVYGLMTQDFYGNDRYIGPKEFPGENVINIGFLETNVGKYDFYVVLQNKENPSKITVQKFSDVYYGYNIFQKSATLVYSYELPENEDLSIMKESNIYNSYQHRSMLYNNKYQVFSWTPGNTNEPRLPSVNTATVSFDVRNVNPNAEITCMTIDVSNRYLFVGVYDPVATEDRKGSLYVLDAFSLELVKKYENIAWNPVSLYYKPSTLRSQF